ncbi:MAG: alpha/beta hydrolase [Pseudonocardiales bacterium]|nr:alpha/beta hydrolase [Pseudonocardiales bacterium]
MAAKLTVAVDTQIIVSVNSYAPAGSAQQVVPFATGSAADLIEEMGTENVSLIGDSCGGGLALAVAMTQRERAFAVPAGTVLFSLRPDISMTDPGLTTIALHDPWFSPTGLKKARRIYRGSWPAGDWRVSPLNGDLTGLGVITILSGTRDILTPTPTASLPSRSPPRSRSDFTKHPGRSTSTHNFPSLKPATPWCRWQLH